MSIHVSGASEFAARLSAAGAKVSVLLPQVVAKTALSVEADAKALAPVDTGAMRASINTTFHGGAFRPSAEVRPGVNYAIYVEMGTSRMAAQPFLFPALDRHRGEFAAAVAAVGKAAVR